jgi:hypothetical protein
MFSRMTFVFWIFLFMNTSLLAENEIRGIEKNHALLKILEITGTSHDGTLKDIVEKTQKSWLRCGERWEAQTKSFEPLRKQLWPFLVKLGHIDALNPLEQKYDAVLVLGALYERTCLRFSHLIKLWKRGLRFDQIYFLVGERNTDPKKEAPECIRKKNSLINFRPDWKERTKNLPLNTETDIAKFVYAAADIPIHMAQIPCIFVNTPRRHKSRPNTADTFKKWVSLLPEDFPKEARILVISNQPYGLYQYAVSINELYKNGFKVEAVSDFETPGRKIQVDVTGTEISQDTSILLILDAIARRLWVTQKYLNRQKVSS